MGLALLLNHYDNDTEAVVEDGVKINTGQAGSLAVTSSDNLSVVNIAESGASVTNNGSNSAFAGAGSFLYTGQNSTVVAAIQAGDDASTIAGDGVSVSGTTTGMQVAIAGALGSFSGSGSGVGISAAVSDLSRKHQQLYRHAAGRDVSAHRHRHHHRGPVTVSSTNGGTFWTIALAGSYDGTNSPAQPMPAANQAGQQSVDVNALAGGGGDNALGLANANAGGNAPGGGNAGSGTTGFGLAGSVDVLILDDATDAFINRSGRRHHHGPGDR